MGRTGLAAVEPGVLAVAGGDPDTHEIVSGATRGDFAPSRDLIPRCERSEPRRRPLRRQRIPEPSFEVGRSPIADTGRQDTKGRGRPTRPPSPPDNPGTCSPAARAGLRPPPPCPGARGDVDIGVGPAHVGADPARMHQHRAEGRVAMAGGEAAGQRVEGGLARPVALPAAALVERDAAEDRAHQHHQAAGGDPVGEGLGEADRAHRVGLVDLQRRRPVALRQRHMGAVGDARHHEHHVEAGSCEVVVKARHGRVVVDVDPGKRRCDGAQGSERRRLAPRRGGDVPAAGEEGPHQPEAQAPRGPDDQRATLMLGRERTGRERTGHDGLLRCRLRRNGSSGEMAGPRRRGKRRERRVRRRRRSASRSSAPPPPAARRAGTACRHGRPCRRRGTGRPAGAARWR